MNYRRHYDALMNRARNCACHGYSEKHHIIPKCMSGTNKADNIVELRPEEHYLAHLLLVKLYPNEPSLVIAAALMSGKGANKKYGWLKRKMSEDMSGDKHHTRRLGVSDETRRKHSLAVSGEGNGMFRHIYSEATREKQRQSKVGKPWSQARRDAQNRRTP